VAGRAMDNATFIERVKQYYDVTETDHEVHIHIPINDQDVRDILKSKDIHLVKATTPNYYDGLVKWAKDFDIQKRVDANWDINPEYWLEKMLTPDLHTQAFTGWVNQVQDLIKKIG
jgi:hypothetical protein